MALKTLEQTKDPQTTHSHLAGLSEKLSPPPFISNRESITDGHGKTQPLQLGSLGDRAEQELAYAELRETLLRRGLHAAGDSYWV